MTTVLPSKYSDPVYETAHQSTFSRPPKHAIKKVLPPGVREEDFARAIQDFVAVVGQESVIIDGGLSDYVDPYDVWEADESKREDAERGCVVRPPCARRGLEGGRRRKLRQLFLQHGCAHLARRQQTNCRGS